MKRTFAATLALSLVGCQTTSYEQYAAAMVRVAEANASVAREQAAAMIALARDGGDQTARTVAILMLAMGTQQARTNGAQLQPPPNEALQWASILLPTVSTLALGWWGWKTNTAAINANSANTIASYEAISSFRQPIDFSTLPVTTSTVTTTNTIGSNNTSTRSSTAIRNDDGFVVSGGAAQQAPTTASQDNRVTTPAPVVVPPVVVVPATPIVPVVVTNP